MSQPSKAPEITPEDMDALLHFLPLFEQTSFKAGTCMDATIDDSEPRILDLSTIRPSPIISDFIRAAVNHGWQFPFDWHAWQPTAEEYFRSPEKLETADVEILQKLLTTHLRKNRFCEGHLDEMFTTGHIQAILRRLKVIRAAIPSHGGTAQ